MEPVALVLCATRGIGYAVSETLLDRGVRVAFCGRSPEGVHEAQERLAERHGDRVRGWEADVTVPQELSEFVASAHQHFGSIDILINNTPPSSGHMSFEELTLDDWTENFHRLVTPIIHACRLAIPHMINAGGGSIVNITTGSIATPIGDHTLSTTLRNAVEGLAVMLSGQYGPQNIRVNCVGPYAIVTDTLKARLGQERIRERAKEVSLRRVGTPEEFAAAVAFFALSDSSFVTGTSIAVDGGFVRRL